MRGVEEHNFAYFCGPTYGPKLEPLMTVIVYKDGVLAADSRATDGWIMHEQAQKVVRITPCVIAAGTGDYAAVGRFFEWCRRDRASGLPAPVMTNSRGIVAQIIGGESPLLTIYEEHGSFELPAHGSHFYAWGSGMPPALAALHMGATAVRAVEVACLIDPNCGGKVQAMKIREGK